MNFLQKKINKNTSQVVILNDWIGLNILINDYYEKDEIILLKKHFSSDVKKNTFIDAGANIGNHSLFFENYFKHIKSFEPQNKIFKILKLNTENSKNIKVFNYGLDIKSYSSKFHIPYSNAGMANELTKDLPGYFEKVSFKVYDQNHNDTISYIKIDVEGNEENVLLSMQKSILKHLPIISFELNSNTLSRKKVIKIFKSFGYEKFYVSEKYFFPMNLRFIKRFYGKPKKLKLISHHDLLSNNNFNLIHTFSDQSYFKLNV
jgi:FkbM family methyltransferase